MGETQEHLLKRPWFSGWSFLGDPRGTDLSALSLCHDVHAGVSVFQNIQPVAVAETSTLTRNGVYSLAWFTRVGSMGTFSAFSHTDLTLRVLKNDQ